MKRLFITLALFLLVLPQALQAQWKVGVNGGALFNQFSMDKQYMTDYRYYGAWGVTSNVVAQCNFNSWLGVRTGLGFGQRNYRQTRAERAERLDVRYRNNYLILPVMASFSFGGKGVWGFTNLGIYGGYLMVTSRSGLDYNPVSQSTYAFSEKVVFNPEKDQRWDFGFTGGVGIACQVARHWSVEAEVLGYYSVVSSVKQYMRVKDYRYNTSLGLQTGVFYLF